MADANEFSGVLLPTRLANTFTKVAYKEGLVEIPSLVTEGDPGIEIIGSENEVEQKQQRIAFHALSRRVNPYQRQKVLEACLLFGKVHVLKNDFFDYQPLKDEGILSTVDPVDYDTPMFFSVERADAVREIFKSFEWSYERSTSSHYVVNFDNYCALIEIIQKFGSPMAIPTELIRRFEKRLGVPFQQILIELQSFVLGVQDAENFLSFSHEIKAPLLIEPAPNKKREVSKSDLGNASDMAATYRVFIDEVGSMPMLRTFSDLKRLLRDPALPDLRSAIWMWSESVRSGRVEDEVLFRKEIRKATNGLQRSTELARWSRWMTYLSIPIGVASAFAGAPIGLALTPVSVGLRINIDMLNNKNRWVAFGR